MSEDKQTPNIPLNFNFDDPKSLKLVAEAVKNMWTIINGLEKRIRDLEKRVFE